MWLPGLRPVNVGVAEQALKAPPSRLHSAVVPDLFEPRVKEAEVEADGFGGLAVISVSGGVVSTVHVELAAELVPCDDVDPPGDVDFAADLN